LGACGADQVARVLQQRLGAGSFVAGERVPSGFEVADLRERLLVVRFVLSPPACVTVVPSDRLSGVLGIRPCGSP
jgi:hypothetical protein